MGNMSKNVHAKKNNNKEIARVQNLQKKKSKISRE